MHTGTSKPESSNLKGYIDQVIVTKGKARYGFNEPFIQAHTKGPVLVRSNGRLHWLTWKERFLCWIGLENASSLNDKYFTH